MRGWAAALVIAALLWSDAAGARAPATSLLPQPRPNATAPVAPPVAQDAAPSLTQDAAQGGGGLQSSPFPRPRPARSITAAAADAVAGAVAAAAVAPSPLAPGSSPRPRARNAAALARARSPQPVTAARPSGPTGTGLCGVAGLEGRRLAPITSTVRGCGIAEPVSLTRVNGLQLTQPATVDCDTARAFERWLREAAVPAMQRHGGGIARVQVAAHYSCRPRNNRPGARISEHGRGRAIDISGFILANGERVAVLRNFRSGPYARALQQMHRAACGTFRTTLGPGSDRFHEDHFHYDLASHRGGGTYCR